MIVPWTVPKSWTSTKPTCNRETMARPMGDIERADSL